MKIRPILTLLLSACINLNAQALKTVAESSNYIRTSRYDEVIQFIEDLQTQSTNLRVENICTTTEGRDVPLLILGDPMPASPQDLRHDHRAVIYIQANIHAGEVEGKEASLMLARDILLGDRALLLEDLIILIAPIFNADGNEKFGNNRRDNGPELAGVRHNGQTLDLNRDAVKLESPEVRGMVDRVLNRWDPALFVDCHTTNGSYHEEPVTYVWGFNPNGPVEIIDFLRQEMMPAVEKKMKDQFNILAIPYGNFMDYNNPEKGWSTAGPQCRYLTNYVGLRNRLSILNENYAYADFKTRVQGCYAFLTGIMEFCTEKREAIRTMIYEADRAAIQRGLTPETSQFHMAYNIEPYDEKLTIRGWEMKVTPREGSWPLVEKLDKKRTYKIPYYCKFIPTRSISFAAGFFISVPDPQIIDNLTTHGILVEKLIQPVTVEVESFQLTELNSDENLYQGHHTNQVKGKYLIEEKTFPPGAIYVSTAQRLGALAAYLLEPESDDGLLVWNFLDRHLITQWRRQLKVVPVHRLLKPTPMVKIRIP